MGINMARKISIEFAKNKETIYTARAGLVPINEVAKKIKLPKAINQACIGVRDDRYSTYEASNFVMFNLMGHLAGLHRTDQIIKSAEAPFIAKLSGLENEKPVATTFSRFFGGFEEKHIQNFQKVNFDLATKNITEVSGYQIITHDQSAIQKYGLQMEGVEKGYGGTLKRGSKMLQCSMIADAGMHTILHLDIRAGSKHSCFNAANELSGVLTQLPEAKPGKRLILGDSAYGIGEYMRTCDDHDAHFILAAKNDSWMKEELQSLDFKRFRLGERNQSYGYREFVADREAWNGEFTNELFGEDWEGTRRVIVVRLTEQDDKDIKYQFLITSFNADQQSAEEVHDLYRKNRESIEQINDEIKNQLGLTELPSKKLDANRAAAQIVALAWNLQRHIEVVGMAQERKDENIRRAKMNIPESRKTKRRFEWWTMFIRFITIGGKMKIGGNKISVIVGQCDAVKQWIKNIQNFDWKSYSLIG